MAIGVKPMLVELAWFLWAFSVSLNLRELQILIYIISLVAGGITKFSLMNGYTQIPLLVFILELVFLFLSSFYVVVNYKNYRMAGGIKGGRHGANKLFAKAGSCFGSVCGSVTKKADELTQGKEEAQQPLLQQPYI